MKKAQGLIEIFCGECDFTGKYKKRSLPYRCPKCRNDYSLSFEKEKKWTPFLEFWAHSNGLPRSWSKPGVRFSLPKWCYLEGKQEEWKKFKASLEDPETVGLPDITGEAAIDYWCRKTGLIDLVIKFAAVMSPGKSVTRLEAKKTVVSSPKIKPFINNYFDYWTKKGWKFSSCPEEEGQADSSCT